MSPMPCDDFVDSLRRGLTIESEKTNIRRKRCQENRLRSWMCLEELVSTVANFFDTESESVLERYKRGNEARQTAMYLSSRYCRGRYSLSEISDYFNIGISGLGSANTKFQKRLRNQDQLCDKISKIENLLAKT